MTRLARNEALLGAALLAPLVLLVAALVVVPVLGTVVDSLFRDVVWLPRAWLGLDNYAALVSDPAFLQSVRFTVLFALVSVPLEVALGLGVALVLAARVPLRGLLRAAVLVPWAVPAAVSGRIFELVYDYAHGAANRLLALAGVTDAPVNWLGTDWGAFLALVVADAWKTTPFVALILLAGLAAIPEDLYRQARVDRAGLFRRFGHVTLPLLRPVLLVAVLFRTIEALRVFDVVYVLTGGGPGGSTTPLSLFAWRYFTGGDFGYGAAASVVLFVVALALSLAWARLGGFGRELGPAAERGRRPGAAGGAR